MNFVPIIIFWILAAVCFFGKRHWILYLFFGSMSFGSFAAIPTNLTAGLTFTPTPVVALLIIIRELANPKGFGFFLAMALDFKKLGLLFWFWIVCIFTTIFMPRIFEGVPVVPVRAGLSFMRSGYLEPTTQNISQLAYISISILSVFAFSRLLLNKNFIPKVQSAINFGAWLVPLTGFLDLISQYVPIRPVLEPFRTASYALLTDNFVQGGKRIIGLMPEASAFGGLSIAFICLVYFFNISSGKHTRNVPSKILLLLLVLFAWLSTSSTAYVSLVVFFAIAILSWTLGLMGTNINRAKRVIGFEIIGIIVALISFIAVILAKPSLLTPIIEMFDKMVLQKTGTDSFTERSMWTRVSFESLYHTFGLGVGLGGTRASNQIVALLSSTGIMGGFLYLMFLVKLFLQGASNNENQRLANNSKLTIIIILVPGLLAGTIADFGVINALLYSFITYVGVVELNTSKLKNKTLSTNNNQIGLYGA